MSRFYGTLMIAVVMISSNNIYVLDIPQGPVVACEFAEV